MTRVAVAPQPEKVGASPGSKRRLPVTGAYQIVLRLKRARTIWVGQRLGDRFLPAGYYVYTGSAMGSGGLEARVRRHLDKTKVTRHWHIDYLTTHPEVEIVEVIRRPSSAREECTINRATEKMPGASVPVPGFGNSDKNRGCACTSHLVHSKRRPRKLRRNGPAVG